MLIEEKELQKILHQKLQDKFSTDEIRSLLKDIHEAGSEWREVTEVPSVVGASISVQCEDICMVGEALKKGEKVRLFRATKDES